jgi:putative spermidine/putrescine transport system substrate-binding protein/spermidine/putrescine transport system substrate-binding protein
MKRFAWLAGLLLCCLAQAEPLPVLHLYNWQGALSALTIQRFEERCQCRVEQSYYGNNEELSSRLQTGSAEFDVVFPSSFAVPALVRQKLLRPLDHALLPNMVNLNPELPGADYDPGYAYSVPTVLSLTAVGYNIDKLKQMNIDPYSWSVIFDPKVLARIKGHVTVLDNPRAVFAAALLYLGVNPRQASDKDYQRAATLISQARPYWAALSNQYYGKELAAGTIWVALGSSTAFFQAREQARLEQQPYTIGYVPQREGNELVINSMAVPADAPHPRLAQRFINFMLASKNAADQSNLIGATNPVRTAEPYLRDDLKYHPVINPDITALRQWIVLAEMNPKAQARMERMWRQLRAGSAHNGCGRDRDGDDVR